MISPQTIAKIQDEADVVDVLSDFITLKKNGSNYKANCPFHNEKTPSFVVSPAKGIYKCFGCGAAGNSVKFVMEHEQMTYVEALKYLAAKYNIEIEETEQTDAMRAEQSAKDALYIANEFARDFFMHNLFETQEGRSIGLSYFKERGFSEDIIKKFQLGYTLEDGEAFTKHALEKGYLLEVLKKAGLTSSKEDSRYDFFRGRVMFPIHSVSGKVLGFGGRTLKSNTKLPKYINTSDTEIYDKSSVLYGMHFARNAVRKLDECLLVEGYTDVISMFQAGVENVVASSGTALTPNQVKLIKRYSENVTLLYDGDAAGVKAALRGVDIILENGLNVKVALLPDGHDPDSFVRQQGASGFDEFLKENKTDFLIFKSKLLSEEAKRDPVKKTELILDIVESISKIPDAIKRSVYVKECAELIGISEQILATEVNKKRKKILGDQQKELSRKEHQTGDEIEVSSINIIEDEKKIEEGINIEFRERNVIRALIEYGGRPFNEEILTIDYLLKELSNIKFVNEIHDKIIEMARERHRYPNFLDQSFFANHEDEQISNFAITLLSSPYSLSDNWKTKFGINVPDISLIYKDDVGTEINYLKLAHLKLLELELLKRLKNIDAEADVETLTRLLMMKRKIDEDKKLLASEKGTSILDK
jgi:DNA primase